MLTRMSIIAVGILLLFGSACTQDVKQLKITESNKDTFHEQVRSSSGLRGDEFELLTGYLARRELSKAFGGVSLPLVGKTVGELIKNQGEWVKNLETREAEASRVAAEAKQKEDVVSAQLRETITLAVYDKGFLKSDYKLDRYSDYITLRVSYENSSAKDIRAFQGVVVFRDLFDDILYQTALKITDPIKAGERSVWSGQMEYNRFDDELTRFRNTDLKDMKIEWRPLKVILSDGTILGLDLSSEEE